MKYLVMECHLSHAVVLAEDGRFLKVANRQYAVGQTVTDVIEMQLPQATAGKKKHKWIYSLAAMAACMVLVVTTVFQLGQATYASVYLTINPEVRIDVNRRDTVVGLEGVNADGEALIRDYSFRRKSLDLVCDQLVDRAIAMGYLHQGGQISLTLDSEDNQWVVSHSDALTTHLDQYLSEKLSVTIEITDKRGTGDTVTLPVGPGESGYGVSDYGQATPPAQADPQGGEQTAVDTDYGAGSDGITDYTDDGQTDYGTVTPDPPPAPPTEDGRSNYGGDDDGGSDYAASHYGSDDDSDD